VIRTGYVLEKSCCCTNLLYDHYNEMNECDVTYKTTFFSDWNRFDITQVFVLAAAHFLVSVTARITYRGSNKQFLCLRRFRVEAWSLSHSRTQDPLPDLNISCVAQSLHADTRVRNGTPQVQRGAALILLT